MTRIINRRIAIILHDLCMVAVAWGAAYFTRYTFSSSSAVLLNPLWETLPLVLSIQAVILWKFGLYRGVWRFASVPDLWNIIRAAAVGVLASALALFMVDRMAGVPRSILAFYPVYLVLLLGTPRLMVRMWKDHGLGTLNHPNRQRVLLLGAGRAGEMLARDMRRDPRYLPVGFLDDQESLKGSKVHGIPVLEAIGELPRVVGEFDVDVIIIAIPSASNAQMQRVVELCEGTGIPFRTVPRFQDLVSGRANLSELREVKIDDLLGREPVTLDWASIITGLAGKSVLVSGAGGSIGSELCRQIVKLGPSSLVLFENNEYNLFRIERELRLKYPDLALHACLGDVRDRASVIRAFETFAPDIVFHAAAYKHVPMLESQAREAVRNNVVGTRMMAYAADRFECESFVMISTDKAVNPANVMGASKRIAELYCQALNKRSPTKFITVRFGNVLGSAGSVVPLFQRQIKEGGPVTVTHPEITRYFMTIPEAAQLIMQGAVMGRGGEIFVLDMGEPVKIGYLAEQMIRLSGKVPGEEIQIVYTGLRPGEKLYEELFYADEGHLPTSHDKILLARSCESDWEALNQNIRALEEASQLYQEDDIQRYIEKLVPELAAHETMPDNVVALSRVKA